MISNLHTWASAWGGIKHATNQPSPRLQGEAFIRALELFSLFLQGNDAAVARMLSETHDEDCYEIMYALLACAYASDEAEKGNTRPPMGHSPTRIADIGARRREQQKITAYRLHRLGWTQEEIAKTIGISQKAYAQGFLQDFPDLEKVVKKLLADGFPHLDIAERQNMPPILVWASDEAVREEHAEVGGG